MPNIQAIANDIMPAHSTGNDIALIVIMPAHSMHNTANMAKNTIHFSTVFISIIINWLTDKKIIFFGPHIPYIQSPPSPVSKPYRGEFTTLGRPSGYEHDFDMYVYK
jgi:hypothetical protein